MVSAINVCDKAFYIEVSGIFSNMQRKITPETLKSTPQAENADIHLEEWKMASGQRLQQLRELVQIADLRDGMRVMDLGCGCGDLVQVLQAQQLPLLDGSMFANVIFIISFPLFSRDLHVS